MSIFKIIAKGSFGIFAICLGVGSYIYITKGVGGDAFIGVCSFGITTILCFILYQVAIWLCQEFSENTLFPKSLPTRNYAITHRPEPPTSNEIEEVSIIEQEEEKKAKEEILNQLKIYTETIFQPYLNECDIKLVVAILEDFAQGKMNATTFNRSLSSLKGLTVKDFMHYGWNIWARLKPMNRRTTARFLKQAFPEIMKDTKESSIYAKMTCDEGAFRINIVKLEDSLL